MSNGLPRIWVQASKNKKNKGRVACHEKDTAHITDKNPEGLLDISPCSVSDTGYEPREVAATPYVRTCIQRGRLKEVPEPSDAEKKILVTAAEKKVSTAIIREEMAEAQAQAKAVKEQANAEIAIAEAAKAKSEAEVKKAEAKTAAALARKAKAEAKKTEAEARKAEAGS